MLWNARVKLCCIGAILLSLPGCGGSSGPPRGEHPTYPVTGSVLYQDQPLANATVLLTPEQSGMPGCYAVSDSQGRFQISTYSTADGAPAGTYRVSVKKLEESSQPQEIEPGVLDPNWTGGEVKSAVPERYNDPNTSGLTAKVEATNNNVVELKLE